MFDITSATTSCRRVRRRPCSRNGSKSRSRSMECSGKTFGAHTELACAREPSTLIQCASLIDSSSRFDCRARPPAGAVVVPWRVTRMRRRLIRVKQEHCTALGSVYHKQAAGTSRTFSAAIAFITAEEKVSAITTLVSTVKPGNSGGPVSMMIGRRRFDNARSIPPNHS